MHISSSKRIYLQAVVRFFGFLIPLIVIFNRCLEKIGVTTAADGICWKKVFRSKSI